MSNGLPCTTGDGQDAIIMITDLVNGGNITLCADHLVGYCVDVVNALPDPEPVHAEPQAATTPGGDADEDDLTDTQAELHALAEDDAAREHADQGDAHAADTATGN